jgi:cytochrome c oxidase subunit 4
MSDAHEGEAFSGHETLYIKIALLLAVLTGMEVAWPYIIDDGPVLMWPLLVMMAIKFVIIAAYFMHLKFDSVILTRIFYSGLFLAVGVYLVALITFGIFGW